ncbi:MAG: hypothetical protein ABI707_17030 [Ferruginibacter sp.]
MGKKKKYLLLLLTGAVLVAAVTVYYLYNKPAIDVQDADGQKVVATALYETFIKDSTAAKNNYTNKILEVSGMVTTITQNQRHQPVVLLKTNMEGAAINCTLEGPAGNIKSGHHLSIKGICNGIGEGDADLGIMGDVYLVRCYVLK